MPSAVVDEHERHERMRQGRAAFLQGDYYNAHELWEDVWKAIEGRERAWVQGLIQLATALYKLEAGNLEVCARLLRKAQAKLADAPEQLDGVDLDTARRGIAKLLAAIERGTTLELNPIPI